MDIYHFVIHELNRRRDEWTAFAQITGMSRKTIERMAGKKHDPRFSHVARLYELLKRSA